MISIEFNASQVTGALDRLSGAMSDLSPVMQDIAEYLVVSTKERFPAGTAPDGTKLKGRTWIETCGPRDVVDLGTHRRMDV